MLLSRDQFREAVFNRDQHKCIICGATTNLNAHHLIERRLWLDGGYYLDNGVTLCSIHHMEAEQTILSVELLRRIGNIPKIFLPLHLYDDQQYDKWGNIILPSGKRLRGELFYDISVQKVLREGGVLPLFVSYVKYPRTHHLPWSPGLTKDDRILYDLSALKENEVVVTVKMDGENTTLYSDRLHARSIESEDHMSQHWLKNLHAQICGDIPLGWRVCGENLYATHTIHYHHLTAYFMIHSVWNEQNVCLSWDATKEWAQLLGLSTVPQIYLGTWDEQFLKNLDTQKLGQDEVEGYVVRVAKEFTYGQFRTHVAKYVRKDHISVHAKHWKRGPVERNELET